MAYEVPDPRVDFEFDDGPFKGAVINASVALSPAAYFGVRQWLEQFSAGDVDGLVNAAREVSEAFIRLGRPTWNLTRDGEPIPATVEGMLSLDLRLIFAIVSEWVGQFGQAPLPSSEASSNGSRSARRAKKRRGSTAGSSSAA